MFTVLFTKSINARGCVQTICVVEYANRMYSVEKREMSYNGKYEYYLPDGYYAVYDSDVDIMEVLKYYLEGTADVPEDFCIDHD